MPAGRDGHQEGVLHFGGGQKEAPCFIFQLEIIVPARARSSPGSSPGSLMSSAPSYMVGMTVGFGLIGTWRVLGHKAAPVLRNL